MVDVAAVKDERVELVVLSIKRAAVRCRPLGEEGVVTFRTDTWQLVPGHILTVDVRKRWMFNRHAFMSGRIVKAELDASRIGLTPLGLRPWGMWDPHEEYWGEEDEDGAQVIPEWAWGIVARGPRPQFEMEQVVPGWDPDHWDDDPILRSVEMKHQGFAGEAWELLMGLCDADLRCLDAHAHLGNLDLDFDAEQALRHYDAGIGIGELTLGPDFDGVLPWSLIDNRPFLRCLFGRGLALWRLNRLDDAAQVFQRLLWLNPVDNQGARLHLEEVQSGKTWEAFASE